MATLFSHLWMFLTHVYNFKYVFNSTVIKLSWHVFCYLISKNLCSLQNSQPFIFQLICMQLCKCINCFLKPHNKQLNQYCLNFTIFYPKNIKKKKKNLVRVWVELQVGSSWLAKNTGRVMGLPVFASGQKNRVRVEYFSGHVRKFWSVLPCLHPILHH